MVEGVDPQRLGLRIAMDDQLHARLFGRTFAQLVHRAELPCRIDMQQRKGRACREERLLGKVEHHGRILADRIEHHRLFGLGNDFAQDVDAFGFEPLQVGKASHRIVR